VQPFELLRHVGPCRITRQYAIVEVSSYQEEVWPVVKRKIDQDVEAVLKVSLPFEPSRTILDSRGIKMIIGSKKDMNRHNRLSSQTAPEPARPSRSTNGFHIKSGDGRT